MDRFFLDRGSNGRFDRYFRRRLKMFFNRLGDRGGRNDGLGFRFRWRFTLRNRRGLLRCGHFLRHGGAVGRDRLLDRCGHFDFWQRPHFNPDVVTAARGNHGEPVARLRRLDLVFHGAELVERAPAIGGQDLTQQAEHRLRGQHP
jgi:hypothetical protein